MTGFSIAHSTKKNWKVRVFPSEGPWHYASLMVPGFPLKSPLREDLRSTLWTAIEAVRGAQILQLSVWLLMDSLHKDGAVHALSRHGAEWLPDFGFGLWPDREPPRMYEERDFLDLEFGAEMPRLMHSVAHITTENQDTVTHAWETMFGTGSTVLALSGVSADNILATMRVAALEKIQDETFRSFPWYFSLIGQKAMEAGPVLLDSWLGPVELYVRESEEDGSIVLLGRSDFSLALKSAGFHLIEEPPQK